MANAGDVDDELARRFRQVFNKEPVSQVQQEEKWRAAGGDEYDVDDEELGKLIEEGAALDEDDVNELVGLSKDAANSGMASKKEVKELLDSARTATDQSKGEKTEDDVSEEDIAALLKQLEAINADDRDDKVEEFSISTQLQGASAPGDSTEPDDSDEIAAILSQLKDEASLEQKYSRENTTNPHEEQDSPFPSVSRLSLPSVAAASTSCADDFSARLANLKSFHPKTYTGKDKGSINVFVPGIAPTDEDETIHWCGICSGDATIKCLGCEGDLYCDECFREGHGKGNMKVHKWKRYRRKAQAF